MASHLDRSLTLWQRGFSETTPIPYHFRLGGWLHIPRGYPLTPEGSWLLRYPMQLTDGRSEGFQLPPGTQTSATFGVPPYPPGQPAFIDALVAAARENKHGGLALAPTRSGKTLCSVEVACRLGGSTLILVDNEQLAYQWLDVISEFVRDAEGRPVSCGLVQGDRFEVPPEHLFTVAMVQTLVRRGLSPEQRRAWRTVAVDECQSAPCDMIWSALQRIESSYVFGLSATPDRKDGLDAAIGWTIGPLAGALDRDLNADVHFLHIPWRDCPITLPSGSKRPAKRFRAGRPNLVEIEKALMADDERVERIVAEVGQASLAGRHGLILCGLRPHARKLFARCKAAGLSPGLYMGGTASPSEMRKNPCVATYGIAAKGLDFQPPPTLGVLASPRADVRQAVGRILQPQASCTPMLLDVVDGVEPCLRWAWQRRRFYQSKKFKILNEVWPR